MNRVNTDCGSWFNMDKAESFDEQENWDGSNHISVNTGSQWEHEQLYRTVSGNWVLNQWSQWQGTVESYDVINDDEAREWLVKNEHHDRCAEFGLKLEGLEV